ncbi:hypothetical protein CLU79DRAFT_764381 [Phycomyces nitens]|nr:hypothetical protein CLU79DRAFT_764381 [Phycomyces nitens]
MSNSIIKADQGPSKQNPIKLVATNPPNHISILTRDYNISKQATSSLIITSKIFGYFVVVTNTGFSIGNLASLSKNIYQPSNGSLKLFGRDVSCYPHRVRNLILSKDERRIIISFSTGDLAVYDIFHLIESTGTVDYTLTKSFGRDIKDILTKDETFVIVVLIDNSCYAMSYITGDIYPLDKRALTGCLRGSDGQLAYATYKEIIVSDVYHKSSRVVFRWDISFYPSRILWVDHHTLLVVLRSGCNANLSYSIDIVDIENMNNNLSLYSSKVLAFLHKHVGIFVEVVDHISKETPKMVIVGITANTTEFYFIGKDHNGVWSRLNNISPPCLPRSLYSGNTGFLRGLAIDYSLKPDYSDGKDAAVNLMPMLICLTGGGLLTGHFIVNQSMVLNKEVHKDMRCPQNCCIINGLLVKTFAPSVLLDSWIIQTPMDPKDGSQLGKKNTILMVCKRCSLEFPKRKQYLSLKQITKLNYSMPVFQLNQVLYKNIVDDHRDVLNQNLLSPGTVIPVQGPCTIFESSTYYRKFSKTLDSMLDTIAKRIVSEKSNDSKEIGQGHFEKAPASLSPDSCNLAENKSNTVQSNDLKSDILQIGIIQSDDLQSDASQNNPESKHSHDRTDDKENSLQNVKENSTFSCDCSEVPIYPPVTNVFGNDKQEEKSSRCIDEKLGSRSAALNKSVYSGVPETPKPKCNCPKSFEKCVSQTSSKETSLVANDDKTDNGLLGQSTTGSSDNIPLTSSISGTFDPKYTQTSTHVLDTAETQKDSHRPLSSLENSPEKGKTLCLENDSSVQGTDTNDRLTRNHELKKDSQYSKETVPPKEKRVQTTTTSSRDIGPVEFKPLEDGPPVTEPALTFPPENGLRTLIKGESEENQLPLSFEYSKGKHNLDILPTPPNDAHILTDPQTPIEQRQCVSHQDSLLDETCANGQLEPLMLMIGQAMEKLSKRQDQITKSMELFDPCQKLSSSSSTDTFLGYTQQMCMSLKTKREQIQSLDSAVSTTLKHIANCVEDVVTELEVVAPTTDDPRDYIRQLKDINYFQSPLESMLPGLESNIKRVKDKEETLKYLIEQKEREFGVKRKVL